MDACSKYNPKFCFGVFQVSCKIHPNPADRIEPFVRLVRFVLVREALPKIELIYLSRRNINSLNLLVKSIH